MWLDNIKPEIMLSITKKFDLDLIKFEKITAKVSYAFGEKKLPKLICLFC